MDVFRTRWLAVATTTAAVLVGIPAVATTTATATTAAATTATAEAPADAGTPPFALEDGSYPDSADVLADTGATLVRGNGGITYTPCDDQNHYQIKIWARGIKLPDERMCFAAGLDGTLTVSIPDAYRIQTYGRDVRAGISVAGASQTLDVPRDSAKGFGEAGSDRKAAVLLELRVTGSAAPHGGGQPIGSAEVAYHAKLDIGDGKRSCSATLVDPSWVLAARSCFADDPAKDNTVEDGAPKQPTTVTVGRTVLNSSGGHTANITRLVSRTDRDLVLAHLDRPARDIAVPALAGTAPVPGEALTAGGFGRTATDWVPAQLHRAAFTSGAVDGTGFGLVPKDEAKDLLCQGDAGGPVVRSVAGKPVLAGITSRTWQTGCLGDLLYASQPGGQAVRVDDIAGWIALTAGEKTAVVVQNGTGLHQGVRTVDGAWSGLTDVEAKAGSIGGVRASAAAGSDGDTHVLALGGDGKVHHTVRRADGSWTAFGDVNEVAGGLSGISRVSAAFVGSDLHVIAIANGRPYHTVRTAQGHWTPFGDVFSVNGDAGTVTSVATANVGGQLHVAVVSGGRALHTIRTTAGNWGPWGDTAVAAGATGPVSYVALAGAGDEAHLVIGTDNGTRQFHALRRSSGSWEPFGDLAGVWGQVTVGSLGATAVGGELQLAAVTSDGKVLHTVRRADRGWAPAVRPPLAGMTGNPTSVALAGTS
ncbi:trypsin-like serine protease [Kitasatospora purpeofusca]|uniref:trypsin-like serine protease n=1 Tax=Kitasatospora purpeofusca TaxID=67352 RepID=UPI0036ECB40C